MTRPAPQPLKKAIFIDRDGTILREPADEQIDALEKVEFVPEVITALAQLMGRGYQLVMVSNQDGLGTASFPMEDFLPPQELMLRTLAGEGVHFDNILIDSTFPYECAPTRKPGTGMLTAYMDGSYDLGASFVVGDRITDLQLAQNLGAQGILLADTTPEGIPCRLVTTSWHEIARTILSSDRAVELERNTSETRIRVALDLDGNGRSEIDSGLKFLDHMLWQLPHHAGISLELTCRGDLEVDEHHSMEDVAILLGEAILAALGSKRGIERYGFVLPMDESRAMVLIDFGGRADFDWDVTFTREYVGDTPTEMYRHFFHSLCVAMKCNLHISARGENNHHLIEGVFKAFARALRQAIRRDPFSYSLPSSKGLL
ncbi:MAG: bifunctional histidinol-phosphatase/imidazoleglycerol-phosphate dehydratase HisB [Bacteroidales bacterium]|nr:bifunctional histidinol-phosphatase/imidazoleglycerol-phosphate dehydratase HisB [Bacteroidales bacterium]